MNAPMTETLPDFSRKLISFNFLIRISEARIQSWGFFLFSKGCFFRGKAGIKSTAVKCFGRPRNKISCAGIFRRPLRLWIWGKWFLALLEEKLLLAERWHPSVAIFWVRAFCFLKSDHHVSFLLDTFLWMDYSSNFVLRFLIKWNIDTQHIRQKWFI